MAGYEICKACDGEEALKHIGLLGSKISLVILDLIMPLMDGKRCREETKAINSAMPVLVASGFTPNGQIKDALDNLAQRFVGKPYD